MTRREWLMLTLIALLFAALSLVGLTWGLPGRHLDAYLFGTDPVWSGETIHRLARAAGKFDPQRGADVDAGPLDRGNSKEPVSLTATPEQVASIYLRYRLYTNQPDEMITLMSLAGMRPGRLQLDPKLYQYGGLFIYPVGALIKLCGLLGLIEVRSDVIYYLDHPDEFAKFYIVARAYSAAWGVLGVFVVFAIGRRLGGTRAGLLAALLFTLLPVVICMSHEAKPHLPGAVLMLAAVWFAMRQLDLCHSLIAPPHNETEARLHVPKTIRIETNQSGSTVGVSWYWGHSYPERPWILMCVSCGAAVGMVLSSAPILILVAVMPFLERRRWWPQSASGDMASIKSLAHPSQHTATTFRFGMKRVIQGAVIAGLVYVITNPYVLINAVVNREVLRSNFGNSLAMYEIARIGEGFVRVLELTSEGATLPILVFGGIGGLMVLIRRRDAWPLLVAAAVFFLQFVLIGAGKPGEYGRFGIFTNAALVIAVACVITNAKAAKAAHQLAQRLGIALLVAWTALCGGAYLWNFHIDTTPDASRLRLARNLGETSSSAAPPHVGVLREPAPYCCPPLNFARAKLILYRSVEEFHASSVSGATFLEPVDDPLPTNSAASSTPISWANKPFQVDHAKAQSSQSEADAR